MTCIKSHEKHAENQVYVSMVTYNNYQFNNNNNILHLNVYLIIMRTYPTKRD